MCSASNEGNCLVRICRRLKSKKKAYTGELCKGCKNYLLNESKGYKFCVNCVSNRLVKYLYKTQYSASTKNVVINPHQPISDIVKKHYAHIRESNYITEKLQDVGARSPYIKYLSVNGAIAIKKVYLPKKGKRYELNLVQYILCIEPELGAFKGNDSIIHTFFHKMKKEEIIKFLKSFEGMYNES